MAIGMPFICTNESGYDRKSIFNLNLLDDWYNYNQIGFLQQLLDISLLEITRSNRQLIENKYDWKNISKKLKQIITWVLKNH